MDVRQTLGELVEQIKQEEVQAALEAAKKSKQPSKQEQPLPQPPGPTDSTAANGEAASEADAAAVTAAAGGAAMMGAAADSGSEGPAHRKEMETPLRSPFVLHAEVLERRKEGSVYGGTWVVCLAVVTCDRHLHLFDLPKVRARTGWNSQIELLQAGFVVCALSHLLFSCILICFVSSSYRA